MYKVIKKSTYDNYNLWTNRKGKTTLATEVAGEKCLTYQKIIEMRIWK